MSHVVPCNFIISLAFPVQNLGHEGKVASTIDKYKKISKLDSHNVKARQFYHIEYFLMPDDIEPKIVDVLVFPSLAKVFLESGIKTVKPWREGDKVWVSWNQSFNVNMTKDLLKKINFHKITMRLWDTKDKVSKKVRYHRLKTTAFSEDLESYEEVKNLVLSQKRLIAVPEKTSSAPAEVYEEDLPGDQEKSGKSSGTETSPKHSEEYEKYLKTEDGSASRLSAGKTPINLTGTTMMEIKELIERTSLTSLPSVAEKQKSPTKGKESDGKQENLKRVKKYQGEEEAESKVTSTWKPRTFSIQLSIMPLLAGWQTVISRGSEKSANIVDCFLSLNTEVPIMTEEQKQDLNPLIIRIQSASCLPSQPVSIHDLERLCRPVYCRYQFQKTPVHETNGEPHGVHVYFQDINVIFLGAMHPSDLREYLEGPPMVVEVHDRDRKSEDYSRKPTLFGEDPMDSYFGIQSFISPKDTENNPSEYQNTLWDPYGVARVSFADLLLGHKYLNLVVPILNCPPKSANQSQDSRNRKAVGFRVPTDVLQQSPMPAGNYMEANSLLKLRVDIAVPLVGWATAPELDFMGTQFSRVIFVFNSKKPGLLNSLLQDITRINAKALDLDSYPTQSIQQILSAFRLHVKIQDWQNLDVLTGFHLLDGKIHLFILEGLADHGLKRLWESYQSRVSSSDRAACKVLYDSQLLFRDRLYADLETVLYHVRLFRPVSSLLRHSALYVRGSVPRQAFQALTRIYDICYNSTRLKEVIVRDLLPSSSMLKDLSLEFGVPISKEEMTDGKLLPIIPQPTANLENVPHQTSTLTLEIRAHQEKYQRWRNNMLQRKQRCKVSLIQKNIKEAYNFTKKPPKPTVKAIRIFAPDKAVHNYSIQTLNSIELAKKMMYQEMAKEPRKRFTYSQNYLSATLEPQDSEEEEKKAQKKSRQAWLTPSGFQLRSLRSCFDRRLLPMRELKEEWKESEMFANVLKPVLDRDRWSWGRRHLDFDLYKKPPPVLKVPLPPVPKSKTDRRLKMAKTQSSKQHGYSQVTAKPLTSPGSTTGHPQDSHSLYDHNLSMGTQTYQVPPSLNSSTELQHPSPSFPSRWIH